MKVFRVQAHDGRGPWRPGWSHVWSDAYIAPERAAALSPWPVDVMIELAKQIKPGEHCGYGCRDMKALSEWFTQQERRRLKHLGFHVVSLEVDRVIREDKLQLFFTRHMPLNIGIVIVSWIDFYEQVAR